MSSSGNALRVPPASSSLTKFAVFMRFAKADPHKLNRGVAGMDAFMMERTKVFTDVGKTIGLGKKPSHRARGAERLE